MFCPDFEPEDPMQFEGARYGLNDLHLYLYVRTWMFRVYIFCSRRKLDGRMARAHHGRLCKPGLLIITVENER